MARLESITRLESSHDFWWLGLDSSHVEKDGDSTRVTLFTEWLENRVRIIFIKSLSFRWANPVRLHTKKWSFFASVMIKIGADFLFSMSSHAILHFKDQVSPTSTEVDLFADRPAGHNVLTLYRNFT